MSSFEIIDIHSAEEHFCSSDCQREGLVRFAQYRLLIIGYPAGNLCRDCAKSLRNVWEENISGTLGTYKA